MTIYNAANNAQTTLATSIDNVATTITVTDASAFPSEPFVITIENEIMVVTAVSGNDLTVTRGQESTAAASHLAGVDVENRWTAGQLAEVLSMIGDLLYTEQNYALNGESLTDSIDTLDQVLKAISDNIGNMTYTDDNLLVDGESITASLDKIDQNIIPISGSNANGEYTKFPDGTMECWIQQFTLDYDAVDNCRNTWTFPEEFISAPAVNATYYTRTSSVAHDEMGVLLAINTTNASVLVAQYRVSGLTDFASGDNVRVQLKAIGRWK